MHVAYRSQRHRAVSGLCVPSKYPPKLSLYLPPDHDADHPIMAPNITHRPSDPKGYTGLLYRATQFHGCPDSHACITKIIFKINSLYLPPDHDTDHPIMAPNITHRPSDPKGYTGLLYRAMQFHSCPDSHACITKIIFKIWSPKASTRWRRLTHFRAFCLYIFGTMAARLLHGGFKHHYSIGPCPLFRVWSCVDNGPAHAKLKGGH